METVELCEFCIDLCHVKWPYFSYIIILAHQLFDNVDICDNVKILFYCGMFALNIEILLQSRFTYLFRILRNSLKRHNYNVTCFDTITI